MMNRREFLAAGLATTIVGSAQGRTVAHPPKGRLFPIAHSGNMWLDNIEEGIRDCARYGFEGVEPFRGRVLKYLDRPQAFKQLLDQAGIRMATCSNGGPMSTDFIDPSKVEQTIKDHARFARDFVAHFDCSHFKLNLGRRPPGGTTDEQLKTMAKALTELGKQTAEVGLKLAPHPHAWTPMERQHEVERILELTDPRYVYLTVDTAHLTLGGVDPVKLLSTHYDRVAAIHWKDAPSKYRGHHGPTPSPQEHERVNLYKKLGTGGVDFVAFTKILRKKKFSGWVTLDFREPRPGEGSVAHNVTHNIQYLKDILHIEL